MKNEIDHAPINLPCSQSKFPATDPAFSALRIPLYLTETQVAEMTCLSIRTLQAWRLRGEGPQYIKMGRSVRYEQSNLKIWIENNTVSSTSEVPISNSYLIE